MSKGQRSTLKFWLILFVIMSSGCEKNDDTLIPPIALENTFSVKIDGELFIPENHGLFIKQHGYLISILDDNSWIITLSNREKTLYLFLKKIDSTGKYPIHESDGNQFFVQDPNTAVELRDRVSNAEYYSLQNAGEIKVLSFEKGQSLILEFDEIILVQNGNSGEKIRLNEGKLNINKETLNR